VLKILYGQIFGIFLIVNLRFGKILDEIDEKIAKYLVMQVILCYCLEKQGLYFKHSKSSEFILIVKHKQSMKDDLGQIPRTYASKYDLFNDQLVLTVFDINVGRFYRFLLIFQPEFDK